MELTPGTMVVNRAAPDWGIGQVQSLVGSRLTANFPEVGKVVIDLTQLAIEPVMLEDSED
jgi:hypothetical protein